jgi:hypothetical protein
MGAREILEDAAGKRQPGGCPDCDAVQTVTQDPVAPNLFVLHVEHDETCPSYRAMKQRTR